MKDRCRHNYNFSHLLENVFNWKNEPNPSKFENCFAFNFGYNEIMDIANINLGKLSKKIGYNENCTKGEGVSDLNHFINS